MACFKLSSNILWTFFTCWQTLGFILKRRPFDNSLNTEFNLCDNQYRHISDYYAASLHELVFYIPNIFDRFRRT